MSRDKTYIKLIHKARWVKLRAAKLSESPLCERCKAEGIVRPATEVHHVIPVEDAPADWEKERLMYDMANLMSLCHGCHVEIHKMMGRGGKAYARRKAGEQLERFKNKFM